VHRILILLISATLVSASATDVAGAVLAGPWMLVREDGGLEIGLELAAGSPHAGEVALSCDAAGAPAALPARPRWRALRRPGRPASEILSITVAAADTRPGLHHLVCAGHRFELAFPARPGPTDTARVAVAGAWNYPSPLDLARLGESLGGPVQLVIALGPQVGERLGSGGWENAIPVLLLGAGEVPAGMEPAPAIAAIAGETIGQWQLGGRWGVLGLPSAPDTARAGRAIAVDLSPWQVFVEPLASWNPGLLAPGQPAGPAASLPLVAICQHMHVPVILAGGGGAGWVSEPLGLDHGALAVVPGGTRYLGATPAGEGLAAMPGEIAAAVDLPALVGLAADPGQLTVALRALGGDELLRLVYLAGESRDHALGPGWGKGDIEELKKTWLAGGPAAGQALDDLGWLTARQLAGLHITSDEFAALLSASATDPRALRLLRRLTDVDPVVIGTMQRQLEALPPALGRDVVLRQLARTRLLDDSAWTRFVASSRDPLVVRAVLLAYDRRPSDDLLQLLLERVRLQAQGEVPLDQDPLLEHRLLVAVFDATTISPTTLRPLAVALRGKVDRLGRGPLERFIARHGEARPP
jgi:hypothetical protein